MYAEELIKEIRQKKAKLLLVVNEYQKLTKEKNDLESEINKLIGELNAKHIPDEQDLTEAVATRKGEWIKKEG